MTFHWWVNFVRPIYVYNANDEFSPGPPEMNDMNEPDSRCAEIARKQEPITMAPGESHMCIWSIVEFIPGHEDKNSSFEN